MWVVWWTIGFLLCSWLIVSCFICAYWFFRPNEWFWDKHKYLTIAIGLGGFCGCVFIVSRGILSLLWFIPESWVYETEEGDFRMVRLSISTTAGLAAAFCFASLHGVISRMRRENERMNTELAVSREVARRKSELELLLEDDELKETVEELKLELKPLEELGYRDRLTRSQDFERRVLLGLLDELEERMEST